MFFPSYWARSWGPPRLAESPKKKGGEEPERKGVQERAGASLRNRPVFHIDLLPGAGDKDGAGAGGSGIYQKRRTDRDAMPRTRQIRTHADGGRAGDAREKAAHARGMDTTSVHAGASGRAGAGRKAMGCDAHIGGVRKDLRARRGANRDLQHPAARQLRRERRKVPSGTKVWMG